MSVAISERATTQTQHFAAPNGDEALMIIDMRREQVGDRTRLQDIVADVCMPTTVSAKKRGAVDELWRGGLAHTTFTGKD